MGEDKAQKEYRGRLAPTPSGYIHEGNIKTFQVAMQRANNANGKLFLRIDDLDSAQVLLELREFRPEGLLRFEMLKGDFRRFEGSWQVRTLPEGSSLLYELTVQGCLGMPIGLIEERLREDLSSNLFAVEREALRRCEY